MINNPVEYKLTYDNNPDILHNKSIILFLSSLMPNEGDVLTINNSKKVYIQSIEYSYDGKHNMRAVVHGPGLEEIREMLTYRLAGE